MSTTHSCVAQLFTSQFLPAEHHDEESSMERGRRAQIEAWSLKRLAMNLVRRMRGGAVHDEQAELEAAVRRLSELSPHLLIDVGVDPETGAILDDAEDYVVRRSLLRAQAPQSMVEPAPEPARKPAQLRLHIRILPDAIETARPLRG